MAPAVAGTAPAGYRLERLLGRGACGEVWEAKSLRTGERLALKKMDLADMSSKARDLALQEARLLRELRHPHIVRFVDAVVEGWTLHIAMQFVGGGDLRHAISEARDRGRRISELDIWRWFLQVASALEYLHRMNILHRDVKPANIFLEGSRRELAILGDLGIAKVLEHSRAQALTQIGTPAYLAPEVWAGRHYGPAADVYSLGCTVYQLAELKMPFVADNREKLAEQVCSAPCAPLSAASNYSSVLRSIVQRMLDKSPEARPRPVDIITFADRLARHRSRGNSASAAPEGAAGGCEDTVAFAALSPSSAFPSQSRRAEVQPSSRGACRGESSDLPSFGTPTAADQVKQRKDKSWASWIPCPPQAPQEPVARASSPTEPRLQREASRRHANLVAPQRSDAVLGQSPRSPRPPQASSRGAPSSVVGARTVRAHSPTQVGVPSSSPRVPSPSPRGPSPRGLSPRARSPVQLGVPSLSPRGPSPRAPSPRGSSPRGSSPRGSSPRGNSPRSQPIRPRSPPPAMEHAMSGNSAAQLGSRSPSPRAAPMRPQAVHVNPTHRDGLDVVDASLREPTSRAKRIVERIRHRQVQRAEECANLCEEKLQNEKVSHQKVTNGKDQHRLDKECQEALRPGQRSSPQRSSVRVSSAVAAPVPSRTGDAPLRQRQRSPRCLGEDGAARVAIPRAPEWAAVPTPVRASADAWGDLVPWRDRVDLAAFGLLGLDLESDVRSSNANDAGAFGTATPAQQGIDRGSFSPPSFCGHRPSAAGSPPSFSAQGPGAVGSPPTFCAERPSAIQESNVGAVPLMPRLSAGLVTSAQHEVAVATPQKAASSSSPPSDGRLELSVTSPLATQPLTPEPVDARDRFEVANLNSEAMSSSKRGVQAPIAAEVGAPAASNASLEASPNSKRRIQAPSAPEVEAESTMALLLELVRT
eukprot:TRINITY_DN7446_c0_g1_i1.p1 TRINITY_DN7446_c0_g1~~TRINITY_DN7446_c0_g1_i1.p1  ORF type:complete len:929 (-),score=132.98 TRINITY_DN7446_c0_g1_i1:408-3194(-)